MLATTKLKYIAWAAMRLPTASHACPGCLSIDTRLVKRKHIVTALYRCGRCELMFRVPKASLTQDAAFYNSEYEQQSTTDMPADDQLEQLKRSSFKPIDKDYSGRIEILEAVGIKPPDSVYDFGASWGYGSWQLRQHGYRVYSYEVATERSKFARDKLGCQCLDSPIGVPEQVDCLFASHVLEHFADPNLLWRVARAVLKPTGVLVLFVPNGEPRRASSAPRTYHQLWGRVHPLLLCGAALCCMAERHEFAGIPYSSPYQLDAIERGAPGHLDGDELLFVARGKQ